MSTTSVKKHMNHLELSQKGRTGRRAKNRRNRRGVRELEISREQGRLRRLPTCKGRVENNGKGSRHSWTEAELRKKGRKNTQTEVNAHIRAKIAAWEKKC